MRALALALAVSAPATAAVDAAARPQGPLAPDDGVLLGAFSAATRIPPVYTRPELARSLAWLESAAGRRLDIYHYYYRFHARFPGSREREVGVAGNRIPMVSWGGTSTSRIAAGGEDRTITARADDVRRFRHPLFIRWFWEMDGADRQPEAGDPATFIAAWRRIVTTFRARGASNAVFVWCPNAWGFETGRAQRYYPGDDYVDWICADRYNWAPVRPRARWTHFSDTFAVWYRWAAARKKPLMVGETGAMERRAGERAAWIDRLRADLRRMPAIGALVYFDTWDRRGYDWRLRTSEGARAAWRRLALDPAVRVARPPVRDARSPRLGIAAAARGSVAPGARPCAARSRTRRRRPGCSASRSPCGSSATVPASTPCSAAGGPSRAPRRGRGCPRGASTAAGGARCPRRAAARCGSPCAPPTSQATSRASRVRCPFAAESTDSS